MMRPTKTLLVFLLAVFCAALPAGAYSVILQDGKTMSVRDFRVVGDIIQGTTMNGGPFAIRGVDVNFQATYMENLEEVCAIDGWTSTGAVAIARTKPRTSRYWSVPSGRAGSSRKRAS